MGGPFLYSILLPNGCDWWVRRRTFERLFDVAFASGVLEPRLEHWRDIAAWYGGFTFEDGPAEEAAELSAGLARAAQGELALLGGGPLPEEDDAYRDRLRELLDAVAGKER